jgi:hypothetical protein
MTKPKKMDASLALELEVGDDSEAYKQSQREVDELLAEDECLLCGDLLDVFGECMNPLCGSHDDR